MRLTTYIVLIVWTLIVFFPLFWIITTAFKDAGDIYPTPRFIPWLQFTPKLVGFQQMFSTLGTRVSSAFISSLVAALGSAIAATFLGSLAGYGLARFKYRLGRLKNEDIAFWFISQRMLPPAAVVFPYLIMFKTVGLIDSQLGLVIAYTGFNLPLAVWIMRDAFRAIPVEIEESALVDGCTRFGAYFRIALPLAAPSLVASILICGIFSWNEFLFALILTFERAQTLPVLIAGQANEVGQIWWVMSALSLIAMAPVVIVGLLLQRFIRGTTHGAFQ
jgi:multiple sugar transport system permease protein